METPFVTNTQLAAVASADHQSDFGPAALAFGPDGNLYVAQSIQLGTTSGDVVRLKIANVGGVLSYDASTPAVVVASTGLAYPTGLTFGVNAGDTTTLYVSSTGSGQIFKVAGATGTSPSSTLFVDKGVGGLDFPTGLSFGPDGKLYVDDLGGFSGFSQVLRINSDGTLDTTYTTHASSSVDGNGIPYGSLSGNFPSDVIFDDRGNLLAADLGLTQSPPLGGSVVAFDRNGTYTGTLLGSKAGPTVQNVVAGGGGIAPSELVLSMPRQSTVYLTSDNFGVMVTHHYGDTIPASAETGGVPATYGVTAFTSITAALDAMSTAGTVDVSAGTYPESVTLIGTETLKLLGNVTATSFFGYTGTTLNLNGFILTPPAAAPVFTSATASTQLTGIGNTFAATAIGVGPITYSTNSSDTLPPGMTFSSSTGVLSGTPTALGVYTLHLTATDPAGSANQTLTVTVDPALIVTSEFDSAVYATDAHTGVVVKTLISPFSSGDLFAPDGAVLGPDGNLYVSSTLANFGLDPNGAILQINLKTGMETPFITNMQLAAVASGDHQSDFGPAGLAFGPDGNLYVAQSIQLGTTSGDVVRLQIDNVGGVLSYDASTPAVVVASTGLAYPTGLTFGVNAGDTTTLYVSSTGSGQIFKVAGATGAAPSSTLFVDKGVGNLDFPTGLSFGPDGKLYVDDLGGFSGFSQVLRINSDGTLDTTYTTHASSSVDGNMIPYGSLSGNFPSDVIFDDRGNLLAADLGLTQSPPLGGSVVAFDRNGTYTATLLGSTAGPTVLNVVAGGSIAPSELVLSMPRQTTVYVSADNFGVMGTLTYGDAIPASAETGGVPATYGVTAFTSITTALDAMSTSGPSTSAPVPIRGVGDADRH